MFKFNLNKYSFQQIKKPVSKGYSCKADFVFILGMHRSGTSCLTGSLERCGLFLGEVIRQGSTWNDNAKGSHELKAAMHIHDEILTDNAGSWYQPPICIKVNKEQQGTLKEIVTQLTKNLPCGIKDPRLLLLLDIWTEIVDSYTMVGTFRHPIAVVNSLVKRNQLPETEAYNLWLKYNTELVQWHKMYRFPIVEFDLSDVDVYRKVIAALAKTLGLKPDFPKLYEFISPELEHHRFVRKPVPATCREIYTYLRYHRYQLETSNDDFVE